MFHPIPSQKNVFVGIMEDLSMFTRNPISSKTPHRDLNAVFYLLLRLGIYQPVDQIHDNIVLNLKKI